jgi:hypothetical protein
MSRHAANPAALPQLSPCGMARGYETLQTRPTGCESCLLAGPSANSVRAVMAMIFRSPNADENFGPVCVSRPVSRLLLGHCFGAYPAPCGSSLFCFGYAALRVTVSLRDPP